jgi:hypothetical protein
MTRTENRKYHYIYKTVCGITDKFYIGMHSTDNLEDGYKGSGKRLWYSIRKHGKENHVTEILEFLSSRDELKLREAKIVNEELLSNLMCMNLKIGGEGGGGFEHVSTEIQNAGRSKGRVTYAKRLKEDKIFADHISGIHRLHAKNAMVNGRNEKFRLSKGFLNKKHSEETIQKMKDLKVNFGLGELNSQFGKCWIYNVDLKQSIKINKEELKEYVECGWIKGRKILHQLS